MDSKNTINISNNYTKYTDHIVHYSDEDHKQTPKNHLITLNYDTMELLARQKIEGDTNHHADPMGKRSEAEYMMLVPKGSYFVNVHRVDTGEHVKKIRLPFRPRSGDAYNDTHKLVFLNARDRPAGVLIDTKKLKIVGQAGFNIKCGYSTKTLSDNPLSVYASEDILDHRYSCQTSDYGGDQISGHPIWLSAETFVIIDRSNRLLHLYYIKPSEASDGLAWETELLQTIPTNSSMHQLIPEDSHNPCNAIFYGMTEGNQKQNIAPRIYKYFFDGCTLQELDSVLLSIPSEEEHAIITGKGGHNLYITPNKKFLYAPVGSRTITTKDSVSQLEQGAIFVINTETMEILKQIPAGKGAGHVAFSPQKDMAIVTNHTDTYVTTIDYTTHEFIFNIQLNFKRANIFNLTQSHMQHVSEDGEYYYNFWSDGGVFFRVNLSCMSVDKSVTTGGVPIQGNFYRSIAKDFPASTVAIDDGYDDLFQKYMQD